jgi:NAD(P)-dependent dehydrogenase (short-subunit alcohol dehydrogenase family)
LTKFMAVEWGGRQIRVNAIVPGAIATGFGGGVVRDGDGVNASLPKPSRWGVLGGPSL